MGCLYSSPLVQYRWCLAGVSPAPCPYDHTVLVTATELHCHSLIYHKINGFGNNAINWILFNAITLSMPPYTSDCHSNNTLTLKRTLEQVDVLYRNWNDMSYFLSRNLYMHTLTTNTSSSDRKMDQKMDRTIISIDARTKTPLPSPFTTTPIARITVCFVCDFLCDLLYDYKALKHMLCVFNQTRAIATQTKKK
eukprot:963228_1